MFPGFFIFSPVFFWTEVGIYTTIILLSQAQPTQEPVRTALSQVTSGVEGSSDLSISQTKKGPFTESNTVTGRVEMFFMTKGW